MTTRITKSYELDTSNVFQSMESMANTYTSVFGNNTDRNQVIRVDITNELRVKQMLAPSNKDHYMHTINKIMHMYAGSVFMAGGLVNIAVDPMVDPKNPVFAKSDIDLFILADPENRAGIVKDILNKLFLESGDDLNEYMWVGVRGSVVYVWHSRIERMIQLILMDTAKYPTIDSVINGFDLDNIAIAFNGKELIIQQRAWLAMKTRLATYKPTSIKNDNQIYRMTKTVAKGYTIINHDSKEDITPSLAQILADKMSRDYLCVHYKSYSDIYNENKNCTLSEYISKIEKYYLENSTAKHVIFVDSKHQIDNVMKLINIDGINNMANPAEYLSADSASVVNTTAPAPASAAVPAPASAAVPAPASAAVTSSSDTEPEDEFELVNQPPSSAVANTSSDRAARRNYHYNAYCDGLKNNRKKTLKLNNITAFTDDDIALRVFNQTHVNFDYYASFRKNVLLEVNLSSKPIVYIDEYTDNIKITISESDAGKLKQFVEQYMQYAIKLFYLKNRKLGESHHVDFTVDPSVEEKNWTTFYASARNFTRNGMAPGIVNTEESVLAKYVKQTCTGGESGFGSIKLCCNAYVNPSNTNNRRSIIKKTNTRYVKFNFKMC